MGTSKDVLIELEHEQRLRANRYRRKIRKLMKAYNLLMDYWDSFPDEEKPEIDKRLKELDL